MVETEELSAQCGKFLWKWKDLMDRQKQKIKELWLLVLDLMKAFRASQPSSGLGLSDAFQLPKEDLASAVRLFRAPEACAVRRMCGGAAPDRHCYLAGVQDEFFALRYCVAGCIE